MGYINSNNEYGLIEHHREYEGRYCELGLYCSDTDMVEAIILPERKRIIINIDWLKVITDEVTKRSVKLLYGAK